jgi:hypothetical protein
MHKLRIAAMIGLMAFAIYTSITNGLYAREKWGQASPSIDSVTKWETRIQLMLDRAPQDVTEFGYVSDWDIPGAEYDPIDQDQEYVLTQYALSPRIVQPGLDHEWIIGNFVGNEFRGWLDDKLTSYELREIGYGIYLIHRTSQ